MNEPEPTNMTRRRWNTMTALVVLALPGACPARTDEVRSLFNGKNLDGWVVEGNPGSDRLADGHPVWSVRDGVLRCEGKGFGFLRYDREVFSDFSLHAAFRMAPKCNSGIGIRTRQYDPEKSRETRPSFYSYEIQLIDDGKPPSRTSNGSLYRYVAPKENALRPAGQWNEIDVTCNGPRIRVVLNGRLIQDVDQSAVEALKKKPLQGSVCLQNHGGRIEFRDIRVEVLRPAKP